jgi:signal peptidase I
MIVVSLVLVVLLGGAAVVVWTCHTWMLITVDGPSMMPTFHPGDRVLVRRLPPRRIATGDVVLAERPAGNRWLAADAPVERWVIKRVAAAPGDRLPSGCLPTRTPAGSRVPTGLFVLLGDNPADSVDSRLLGYCPGWRIIGVTVSARTHRSASARTATPDHRPGSPG